jgi:hypothetical protein
VADLAGLERLGIRHVPQCRALSEKLKPIVSIFARGHLPLKDMHDPQSLADRHTDAALALYGSSLAAELMEQLREESAGILTLGGRSKLSLEHQVLRQLSHPALRASRRKRVVLVERAGPQRCAPALYAASQAES